MKKLISMTDFVLEIDKTYSPNTNQWYRCFKYANFLRQKLELWMFVPCKLVDGVWVALPEWKCPSTLDKCTNHCNHKTKEYQEAKERVLFEGFELKGETDYTWIFKHNNTFPVMISKNRNIEYLNVCFKKEITLTASAQKQIG